MSMPMYTIKCSGCDYATSNRITWGHFEYESGEKRLSVKRDIAWCNQCHELAAVESFTVGSFDEEWIWVELDSLQQEVMPSFWRYIRARFNGQYRKTSGCLEQVRSRIDELLLAIRRKGTERCLTCGSQDLKVFHVADAGMSDSLSPPEFIHPGCGGQICTSDSSMRISMAFRHIRVYSLNGEFLREEPIAN